MTAILADDELHCREVLSLLLEMHCPQIKLLAQCEDGHEALAAIEKHQPNIVFLDIEMPGMNAFDVLKNLPSIDFQLIFTTAYDQYAIKAIKFSALDYLLKPIDADELIAAVEKANTQNNIPQQQQIVQLQHQLQQPNEEFKLVISTSEGTFFIAPADIVYCEGINNYTHFHLTRNRKIISSRTLKEFEQLLTPHHFLRIHKSLLANMKFIEKFSASRTAVVLKDGEVLEVSRRRKDEVMNALFNK